MTWFLYKQPNGRPDLSEYELNLEIYPGYTFIGAYEDKPDVQLKHFNDQNELVSVDSTPQYITDRKYAYPSIGDQMDALWHAMDDGTLPKVEPFYSDIKAVKEQFPKA